MIKQQWSALTHIVHSASTPVMSKLHTRFGPRVLSAEKVVYQSLLLLTTILTFIHKVAVHQKHASSTKDIVCTPADGQSSNPGSTPSSIHIPPTSPQLSKSNSLMWALAPHAQIVDYTPPPVVFNSITMEYPQNSDIPLSSYSSLAGALDDTWAQKESASPQLMMDSFDDWFSSLTSNPNK